jgi:hypothetical protein
MSSDKAEKIKMLEDAIDYIERSIIPSVRCMPGHYSQRERDECKADEEFYIKRADDYRREIRAIRREDDWK